MEGCMTGNEADMAQAVLTCAANQYMNGETIRVDGGYLLSTLLVYHINHWACDTDGPFRFSRETVDSVPFEAML